MEKRGVRLIFAAAIVIFACLLTGSFTAVAQGQQEQEDLAKKVQPQQKVLPDQKVTPKTVGVAQFKIGAFTVIVETTPSASAERQAAEPAARTQTPAPAVKDGTGYSGRGHIVLRTKRVPVTFSGIVVAGASPGQVPVASAGLVSGTAGPAVEYDLDGFKVSLNRASIRLMPERATAAVGVTFPQSLFSAPGQGNSLALASETCAISPDGAVNGENFHGPASVLLRDSVYRLEVAADAMQAVHVGPAVPAAKGRVKPAAGCVLSGVVSFEGTAVFSFRGTVEASGRSAVFDLVLLPAITSVVRAPEPEYELTLLSGSVSYRYEAGGKLACDGEFGADLKLPRAVADENEGQVSLSKIALKTDQTGALFNTLSLPGRLRAGFGGTTPPKRAIFLLEPAPNAAYVYFPRWQVQSNSTYPMITAGQKSTDVTPGCKELDDFLMKAPGGAIQKGRLAPATEAQRKVVPLRPQVKPGQPGAHPPGPLGVNEEGRRRNVYGRPGLTIYQGTLYFKSPQATFPDVQPDGDFNLKTRFFGLLTATPWGLNGSLTSSGNSFVVAAASKPIEECSAPSDASQPTWDEIVSAQKANPTLRPKPKPGRFQLAELRILEMRVETLSLCMNALPDKGATMAYVVHFPFPSCLDLDFVDQSLDAQGRFHAALGPDAPEAQTVTGPSAGKKSVIKVPQVRILWAYRLPVTLADRDVAVLYPTGQGPAGVQVPPPGAQQRSELWLKPLYSKNSAIKAGVRFSATLTPKGVFELKDWDREPILCGAYPLPGKEMEMGFECDLSSITLADNGAAYNPVTRRQDFGWSGKVRFPFFGRQGVAFGVKDLVPDMPEAIAMTNNGGALVQCPGESGNGILGARIRDLRYRTSGYPFVSDDAVYWKSPDNRELRAERAEFASFLCAQLRMSPGDGQREDKDLTPYILPGPAEPGQAEHRLKNAVSSKSLIDLVCYDQAALNARNAVGSATDCCAEYWIGTYEVTAGPPQARKVILRAANVKCNLNARPVVLGFNGSQMALTPEGEGSGERTLVNIPGVQLKLDNGALRGNFSTDAASYVLPNMRGECAFFLDVRKGYFAVMIAGSYPITPFPVNVEGESFIVHAPLETLRRPAFGRDDSILNRVEEWALFPPDKSLEKSTGMEGMDGKSVISGVLLSGNAAALADLKVTKARVARGAGLFFYHFDSPDSSGYRCGFFQNNTGNVDVGFIEAKLFANWDVSLGLPSTFDDVKRSFLRDSNPTLGGRIWAYACASIFVAHAYVVLDLDAWINIKDGFGCSGRAGADAGAGDCPARPRY